MKKMINKQRVRRIKNFIYALIIVVLFLPLILMSVLSLSMIKTMEGINDKLDNLRLSVSQQTPSSASDSGYVIEPEGQSAGRGIAESQGKEENNSGNVSEQAPSASGDSSEASGAPPSMSASEPKTMEITSNSGDSNADSADSAQPGALESDAPSGSGGEDLLDNPETGGVNADSQFVSGGYNGNPLTGR